MPLDPATLCARTATGDAELAAPRHGLAIAQRRLLSFLDQPLGIDELVRRPGVIPERLERDLKKVEKELKGVEAKLGRTDFVERAPEEIVDKERERASTLRKRRAVLGRHLAALTRSGTATRRPSFRFRRRIRRHSMSR